MREELDNGEGFDELLVDGFSIERDLDSNKLRNFLQKAGMDSDLIEEEALWKLGVAEAFNDGLRVNNATVLFFAKASRDFVRQSVVTCIRYQGNTRTAMIDRVDLDCDLLSLVDEAEAFVKKNTRIASKIIGFKRVDVEEYPYAAVREAIINAVSHRNYSFDKTGVYVNIFDDRIEVISPGSIPHGLTLKEVQGKSFPRNYLIHSLFEKVHFVEKSGSGFSRMNNLMEKHGLKKPVYEAGKVSFQVTFYGPKEKILDLIKPSNEVDLRGLGLNERQINALKYLFERESISNKEYCKLFKVSNFTAYEDLNLLFEKNLVKKEGRGRSLCYKALK